MRIFIDKDSSPGLVVLRARAVARGPEDVVGDLIVEVRPGESALGRTYLEWRALETSFALITEPES